MKHIVSLSILSLGLSSLAAAQTTADDKAITAAVMKLEEGWNARNGEIFAQSFAPVHDYIVWTGVYFPGMTPEKNAMAHHGIFSSIYKNTDLKVVIDKIRYIREDLALVHVLGATYDHGTTVPENPAVIISMLFEKQNGAWKIISFHNCDIEISFEPGAQTGSPVPANVMYGKWYGK
jgi:uncharacterized protein (TIGR02246 family)